MKKLLMILLLVLVLCFTFSYQQREDVAEMPVSDIGALRNWVNGNMTAAKSGDMEDYLSFWTDDVIWMPPGSPIIKGKSAAMDHIRLFFEELSMDLTTSSVQTKGAEDFGIVRINSYVKHSSKTGEPTKPGVKGIFLLKRMQDGKWLCTHAIWNRNGPARISQ